MFCKFKWYHVLYGFGVEICRDCNGDVHVGFCATSLDRVWNIWPYQPAFHVLLSVNFCACWLLIIWSFQVFFSCPLQIFFIIKPAPSILSYAMWLGFHPLLHLPCVKFTDTTPSPESMFYFHVVLFSVNCFWWSCHVDMSLTPNLRLRPKPIECK